MLITGFCLQKCMNFLGHRGVCCNHVPVQPRPPDCTETAGACTSIPVPDSCGCWKEAGGLEVPASLVCCLCMSPPSRFCLVWFLVVWDVFSCIDGSNHAISTNTTSKGIKFWWMFCIRQNCRIQLTGNVFVHAIIYFTALTGIVAKPKCT